MIEADPVINGDVIAQVIIACTGVTAVWLSQSPKQSMRRWACVLGLISQPAWFFTVAVNGQFGLFIVAIVYTFAWSRGFYYHWVLPRMIPR